MVGRAAVTRAGLSFTAGPYGECVGSVWLNLGPDQRATVGYWLLGDARRRGLVTHALLLVSRWAFDTLGVKRIGLLADPRNAASLGVAERAGFKRQGVLCSDTFDPPMN